MAAQDNTSNPPSKPVSPETPLTLDSWKERLRGGNDLRIENDPRFQDIAKERMKNGADPYQNRKNHEDFAKQYPQDYASYRESEKKRVYAKTREDPLYYQFLEKPIQDITDKHTNLWEEGVESSRVYRSPEHQASASHERGNVYHEFITAFPEKAQEYRQQNPELDITLKGLEAAAATAQQKSEVSSVTSSPPVSTSSQPRIPPVIVANTNLSSQPNISSAHATDDSIRARRMGTESDQKDSPKTPVGPVSSNKPPLSSRPSLTLEQWKKRIAPTSANSPHPTLPGAIPPASASPASQPPPQVDENAVPNQPKKMTTKQKVGLAAGLTLGAGVVAAKAAKNTLLTESKLDSPKEDDHLADLKQAHDNWLFLLSQFPDLQTVETVDQFLGFLEEHRGEINPVTERPFTEGDWVMHNLYLEYLLRVEEGKHEQPHDKKDEHKEAEKEHSQHQLEPEYYVYEEISEDDPRIQAEKVERVSIPKPPSSSFSSAQPSILPSGAPGGGRPGLSSVRSALPKAANGLRSLASKANALAKIGRGITAVGGFIAANWWWILIVILAIFIIIIIIVIILAIIGHSAQDTAGATVSISKSVDKTEISNPPATPGDESNLTYTLTLSYTGTAQGVVVTDHLSDDVEFVSADGPGSPTYDDKTRTVTWNIPLAGGSGSGGGPVNGDYIPPNSDTCGGKYDLSSWPAGLDTPPPVVNYGDPTCNGTKDNIYNLLKQEDPQNADFWFNTVIPCESAYDPNTTFRCGSDGVCTPDPGGAWGLFQDARGANGAFKDVGTVGSVNAPDDIYDRGDVNWPVQIKYAVQLQKERGWAYWACAQ